mmetsp:Transcript_42688/g.108516  ORF Transcript_42688/g.108516 Transcript_42688/m.108516 type:complete len:217 (-) Transcript_42688:246-896(-)
MVSALWVRPPSGPASCASQSSERFSHASWAPNERSSVQCMECASTMPNRRSQSSPGIPSSGVGGGRRMVASTSSTDEALSSEKRGCCFFSSTARYSSGFPLFFFARNRWRRPRDLDPFPLVRRNFHTRAVPQAIARPTCPDFAPDLQFRRRCSQLLCCCRAAPPSCWGNNNRSSGRNLSLFGFFTGKGRCGRDNLLDGLAKPGCGQHVGLTAIGCR